MTLDLEQKSPEALISCGFRDIFDVRVGETLGMFWRQKAVSLYC
jgi:hypothetical protein